VAPGAQNATPAASPASEVNGDFNAYATPGATPVSGKLATETGASTLDLPPLLVGLGLVLVLGASGVLVAGRLAGR
jgi:hypothetical protein